MLSSRKTKLPGFIILNRLHELISNQAGQIKLTQPAILPFGSNEIYDVRMSNIECSHLRTPSSSCGRHGEAHRVEDIHKRQWTGSISTRSTDKSPFGSQSRELIANTAARFQGQSRFMHGTQDTIHRIRDSAGNSTVYGAGRWLMFSCTCIGSNSSRWYCPIL